MQSRPSLLNAHYSVHTVLPAYPAAFLPLVTVENSEWHLHEGRHHMCFRLRMLSRPELIGAFRRHK